MGKATSLAGTPCGVDRRYYTVQEVAKMLPIGKTRIYQLLAEGAIPSIRLGRKFIVPMKRFDEWLDSGGRAA